MGLFGGGKTCCECGKKAGLLSRVSLKDGSYLCGECRDKLSDQLDGDAFKMMSKEDYEQNIEVAKENDRKYKEEYRETFSVSQRGNKVFSADELNGWWVYPKYERPILLHFDQIQNWNVELNTQYDTDDENRSLLGGIFDHFMRSSFYESMVQNHPEIPVCPADCTITGMYLHIHVGHPMIREVVIDCFDVGLFTMSEDDMQNAYSTVIQIIEFLQKVKDGAKASAAESDTAEQLRNFKKLLDEGVLTQEEFDAKKKQILGL